MTTSIRTARFWADVIDLCMVIGLGALFHIIGWLVSGAYWLCRDGFFEGQSIGKRLMGLKVVIQPDAARSAARGTSLPARMVPARSAGRCTWKTSFLRNFLWAIPIVNVLAALTGLYYWCSDPQGRHWGDRLANTEVVKA